MQEERLQILKMVEDGKINVDDATKLFEALRGAAVASSPSFEEKFNNFTKDTKEFFKDIGSKVNEMYKKAEPKIKGATKVVASKTAEVCDSISQSLNDKLKKMEDEKCCSSPCEPCTPCETVSDNGPPPQDK